MDQPLSEAPVQVSAVVALYQQLLVRWNEWDAAGYAALFASDGSIVGFDGSQVNSAEVIAAHLSAIFADYPTPTYVARVRDVRLLTPEVALLHAVVGLVPRG